MSSGELDTMATSLVTSSPQGCYVDVPMQIQRRTADPVVRPWRPWAACSPLVGTYWDDAWHTDAVATASSPSLTWRCTQVCSWH